MASRGTKRWIAFSSRLVHAATYDEARDALSQDWTAWCRRHGVLPLALPNDETVACDMLAVAKPALLILTGGNDAVPRADGVGDYEERRNRAELALIARALETGLPMLGVCRGMHMLNLSHGGTVEPDLGSVADGHVAKTHRVSLETPLLELAGTEALETNSFHRQGFRAEQVGAGFRVCAHCEEDDVVEAIARDDAPVIGIGWHPERDNPARALDDAILFRLAPEILSTGTGPAPS